MPWTLLAAALLVLPILEIYVIIQVGQVIGAPWTIALLIFESVLGAWIVKREGRRAWAALQVAFSTGRWPGRELSDAALVLVGGTLLLTPGFVTDVAGFFFVLPFTRPLARRGLSWLVARSAARRSERWFGGPGAQRRTEHRRPDDRGPGRPHERPHHDGRVVPGEVVDDD